MINNKVLVLVRGVAGAGKTTLTKFFDPKRLQTVSADDFFYGEDGNYQFDAAKLHKAHTFCRQKTEKLMSKNMKRGDDKIIIVHNTFTTEKEIKPYKELAEQYDHLFVSLIVENRHGNVSVHDVPEATIEKMKNRFSVNL